MKRELTKYTSKNETLANTSNCLKTSFPFNNRQTSMEIPCGLVKNPSIGLIGYIEKTQRLFFDKIFDSF